MSSLPMPRSDSSASNCCLVDEVPADRVLQVGLPVELDGAGDVAGVVGGGVLVDLDEDDARGVEVLLGPVGRDECGVATHRITPLVRMDGESARGAFESHRARDPWKERITGSCDGAAAGREGCRAVRSSRRPPSDDGATQAGGHAAQVDRAPFGEQRAHEAEPTSGSDPRHTRPTTIRDRRRPYEREPSRRRVERHVAARSAVTTRPSGVRLDLLHRQLERQLGQLARRSEICLGVAVEQRLRASGTFGRPSAVTSSKRDLDHVPSATVSSAVPLSVKLLAERSRAGRSPTSLPSRSPSFRPGWSISVGQRWRTLIVPVPSTVAATTSPCRCGACRAAPARRGRRRRARHPDRSRRCRPARHVAQHDLDLLVLAVEHLGQEREPADVTSGCGRLWRSCVGDLLRRPGRRSPARRRRPPTRSTDDQQTRAMTSSRIRKLISSAPAPALARRAVRTPRPRRLLVTVDARSRYMPGATQRSDDGSAEERRLSWRTRPARRARNAPSGPCMCRATHIVGGSPAICRPASA